MKQDLQQLLITKDEFNKLSGKDSVNDINILITLDSSN